jgi:hypothetical protein
MELFYSTRIESRQTRSTERGRCRRCERCLRIVGNAQKWNEEAEDVVVGIRTICAAALARHFRAIKWTAISVHLVVGTGGGDTCGY